MKKIALILSLIFLAVVFPTKILAHGGVEKTAGNILVTLFQTPLSPLVGEKVDFAFILTDPTKSHVFKNKQARIVITQTTTGDPSKDTIVYSHAVSSDVNGTVNFSFVFPKTNYYDIDLQFGKSGHEANTTGFLVQPRENLESNIQYLEIFLVVSIILNFVFIFYWLRNFLRTIHS